MLLTIKDVAERLKASPSTVYELVSDGKLPCYRIGRNGGAIRISEEDLNNYLTTARRSGEQGMSSAPAFSAPVKLKHLRA
jgi:excisionase family DNA binding protein